MRRYYLKLGDKSSAGGTVIDGIPSCTHDGKPLTFIGARVACPACKKTGRIIPSGSRQPARMMGKEPALTGDRCACGCSPPPIMLSSQNSMAQSSAVAGSMKTESGENEGALPKKVAGVAPAQATHASAVPQYLDKNAPPFSGAPLPKIGSLPEAAHYIFDEMKLNLASPEFLEIRHLEEGYEVERLYGLYRFKEKVKPHGPWDHKKTLHFGELNAGQTHRFRGRPSSWFADSTGDLYSFDIFSNVHYGYIGTAVGYSEDLLLDAAGAVQTRTQAGQKRVNQFVAAHPAPGNLHPAYWHPDVNWGSRGWDDPLDQSATSLGIYLYRNYGPDLNYDDFVFELRNWPGLNKVREAP